MGRPADKERKTTAKGDKIPVQMASSSGKHNIIQPIFVLAVIVAAFIIGSFSPLLYSSRSLLFGSQREYQGSTFTIWGKQRCTQNSLYLYSGYAAGHYPTTGYGGSAALECLSTNPSWVNDTVPHHQSSTMMTAAIFSVDSEEEIFNSDVNNATISCAACISKGSTMMVPGATDCPDGWYREYYGYLMSSSGVGSEYYFASKSYCIVNDPEARYSSQNNTYGPMLSVVQAGHCPEGREPCSKYPMGMRISCAVCTKA